MKKQLFIIIIGVLVMQNPAVGQDTNMLWNLDSALPLQAAVCDVAGIGRALSQDDKYTVFQIDQFWYGSVTNNPVRFYTEPAKPFPTNGTAVVFFCI